MTAAVRILLLAIDAASSDRITEWAASGVLPTFRRLMEHGLVGDTESVEGFFVGSTWPSFYTGVSPARHGIHSLVQLRGGTYELYRCYTGDFVKREPFWNALSRAGRRVAICDVPLTGVSSGLHGMQMVEWGSHDANYGFRTWPPKLARDVRRRFGLHPMTGSCDAAHRSAGDYVELTRRLVEGVRRKATLTRYYLARGPWDFFAQVFTESHCVGHQCWHLHDPRCPNWDASLVRITGDPVRTVYVAIDTAIGEILQDIGRDTLVIVLVSHDMSHRYGAQFLLRDLLVQLGVAASPLPRALHRETAVAAALRWGWARTPEIARRPVRRALDRAREWSGSAPFRPALPEEAAGGRCFPIDNGLAVGGIRLNIAGREPRGTLAAGAEAEAFCRDLASGLLEVVDRATGEPIVRRVLRTVDLYRGEHEQDLPDVLVDWSDTRPLGSATVGNGRGALLRVTSPRIGTIEGANTYSRTGDHRRKGMFVGLGPGVTPGRIARPVSIMDFAPTVAQRLGTTLPDLDGHPIREVMGGD